jgi:PPOX class probable FMN-dependent enzyme
MAQIESVEALRELYNLPSELARRKQLDRLDAHCRRFIELSPFMLVSSSGADGLADVSPRGDQPGFVRVIGERTLAIPDRRGNNRLDTLTNIVGNPAVGLIFLIPGYHETLRINGSATIDDDPALLEDFAVNGKPPVTVLMVTVREAYLHCAKSILRSRLWQEDAKTDRSLMPSMGQMIKDQTRLTDPVESQDDMIARFQKELY